MYKQARWSHALDQAQVVELLANESRQEIEILVHDWLDIAKGADEHEATRASRGT